MIQPSYPNMSTGKTIPLTIWSFVSKVISLLFNMLSRFVIAFPPRSKHLLISLAAVTICSNFGAQKKKIGTASTFPPSYLYDYMVIAATVIGLLLYQIPARTQWLHTWVPELCPAMLAYASVVSSVGTNWSRMILTGLTWLWAMCVWFPSSSRLAWTCSQSSQDLRAKGSRERQGLLRSRLRNGTRSLSPHSICQISILSWSIPMDRGAWQATVHGVIKSDLTEQLSTV